MIRLQNNKVDFLLVAYLKNFGAGGKLYLEKWCNYSMFRGHTLASRKFRKIVQFGVFSVYFAKIVYNKFLKIISFSSSYIKIINTVLVHTIVGSIEAYFPENCPLCFWGAFSVKFLVKEYLIIFK